MLVLVSMSCVHSVLAQTAVVAGAHLVRVARQQGRQAPVSLRTRHRTAAVTLSLFHLHQSRSLPTALAGRLKVMLQAAQWFCDRGKSDNPS